MPTTTADRVMERSTTTGTGPLALAGAFPGCRTFLAAIGNGVPCYYTAEGVDDFGQQTGEWEDGIGTLSGGATLSRDTVLNSSNGGAAVNFSAGTRRVFASLPAEAVPLLGAANRFTAAQRVAALRGDRVAPAQMTTDQVSYDPGAGVPYRHADVSTDATHVVESLAGGADGLEVRLYNAGSFPVVMRHESTLGPAADRVRSESLADVFVPAGSAAPLVYNAGLSRWLAAPPAAGLWRASDIPGLVFLFDCALRDGEAAPTVFNRVPGGANGTIGSGASYNAYGIVCGGSAGFIHAGIPESSIRTLLVLQTPQASSGVTVEASDAGVGVTAPQIFDFSGDVANGQIYPRFRDTANNLQVNGQVSARRWPCVAAYTQGNPGRVFVDGVEPGGYDAQDNLTNANRANNLQFGGNFAGTAAHTTTYHAIAGASKVLTPDEVYRAGLVLQVLVAARNIPPGGPATLSGGIVTLTGNSLVANMDVTQLTTAQTLAKVKCGFGGTPPSGFSKLADTSTIPLFRPNAARNFAFVWPTALLGAASDITNYIAPLCRRLRQAGLKVIVGYPCSHTNSANDVIKNAAWAVLDDPLLGWTNWADAKADFRTVPEISADGAFNNPVYYLDTTHFTTGATGGNTGYGKAYPVITAAIDSLG